MSLDSTPTPSANDAPEDAAEPRAAPEHKAKTAQPLNLAPEQRVTPEAKKIDPAKIGKGIGGVQIEGDTGPILRKDNAGKPPAPPGGDGGGGGGSPKFHKRGGP